MSGIGNIAPIAPPSDIAAYPPASDQLELIDLLVTGGTGTHQETFPQKIQSILTRTPRIGTPTKPDFFPYKMVGSLTALPHTELMERLHIQQIYINPLTIPKGLFTVKAAIQQLKPDGKKALRLYTFSATEQIQRAQRWKIDELTEVIFHLKITESSLADYEINEQLQVSGKIYQVNPSSFNLQEEDIRIVSRGQSRDLGETFRGLIEENPLPEPEKKTFKAIEKVVAGENLEPLFNELPKYCANLEEIDDARKEDALKSVAQEVEKAAQNIIRKGIFPIYKHWQEELKLSKYEVSSHGYVVGILENLFKYRYALDIAVEKNLGLGRADLTFVSRLDGLINKNWNGIPVCIEFKAGESCFPVEGLEQINKQGYLHITPRTRSLATYGVGLGVNFAFSDPVRSQTVNIKVEPINFVKILLDAGHLMITSDLQDVRSVILKKLNKGLADVDYSIIRQNGSPDNSNYFKNFILGQAMGFEESGYSTYALFKEPDPYLSLFFVKENEVVIVNINRKGLHLSDRIEKKTQDKLSFLKRSNLLQGDSSYFMLTVEVNSQSTPTVKNDMSGRTDPLWSSQEDFSLVKIEPFKFIQQGNLAHQKVAEQLSNFINNGLKVIQLESDEQALWQGGLLASGDLKVYTESNHVLGKRADLVLSSTEGKNNLKVIELKYARDTKEAEDLHARGTIQVGELRGNLKSFSDERDVDLCVMTYDAKENTFIYNKWLEKIEHTSDSEQTSSQGEESPRKSVDFDPPTKQKDLEDASKESGISILAKIFGGIASVLGTILLAGAATAISVLKGVGADVLSGISNIRGLSPDQGITSQELDQLEQLAEELMGSSTSPSEKLIEKIKQHKTRMENLEKKFKEQREKVDKNIERRVAKRKKEQLKNKAKKQAQEAGPSRAKRSVLFPVPEEEEELPAEGLVSPNGDNCTSSGEFLKGIGIVRETVPNKLFSLCRIQLEEKDEHGSHENDIEEIELDCYLEIDYQNKDSVLVDASLWDLANKTIRYEDGVVSLSLPLLKEGAKRLVLGNASRVYYEFIDTHANIFTLPLHETQTYFPTNQTETSTEELEEATTPVNSLEIEEKENRQVEIANCSRIELSASHNESYVEGDCVINPTLNSIDVIEINPSPDQDRYTDYFIEFNSIEFNSWNLLQTDYFIEFNSWNLLQNAIEYREANNTLAITVKGSDAIGIRPFQVKLRNYLNRELNSTSYKLSDKVFEQVSLVFTQRNDEVLQQQRSAMRITSFHIKTSIPETVFNQKGDKASNILTWYKNITQAEAGIEVYGEVNVKGSNTALVETRLRHHGTVLVEVPVNPPLRGFGSKFNDKIWVYDDFMYVYGGEGTDCYIVEPNRSGGIKTTFINNDAEDELQDYLVLPIPFRLLATVLYHNNSVQFFSTQGEFARKMVLANYCTDSSKQHLAVLTNDGCLIELPWCELLAKYKRKPQRISRLLIGDATASAQICNNTTMEEICNETTERNHRNPIRTKRAVNDRIKIEKQDELLNKKRKAHRIFKPVMEQSSLKPLGISYDQQMPRIGMKEAAEKSSNVQPRYDVTAYENMPFIKWLSYLFGRRSFNERMNKAEQAGSLYENDQDSSLYWAEKRLKKGIMLYGSDGED